MNPHGTPRPTPDAPTRRKTAKKRAAVRSAKALGLDTRDAVFSAAAAAFSAHGFAGTGVDHIADRARVNKAMIYYHFSDKLELYREVVRDMLRAIGAAVTEIADAQLAPVDKIDRFILTFARLADERPWFPTLMLREIAEGAPHLDLATLGLLRTVFMAFGGILLEGQAAGVFRPMHPVLAYTSIIGPLVFNTARERIAAQPGREHLPMLVEISHAELVNHLQQAAHRILALDPPSPDHRAPRASARSRRGAFRTEADTPPTTKS
ncbi:MAG: TetR/AcrR family transcriptional regulator [Vicinamibacterales bacterium]